MRELSAKTLGVPAKSPGSDAHRDFGASLVTCFIVPSSHWSHVTRLPRRSPGEGESLLNMKVILETDRLLLREYVEEDAEAFFTLNTDPEVLRFVPDKAPLNVEQARHY